jgi:hypothetical protein
MELPEAIQITGDSASEETFVYAYAPIIENGKFTGMLGAKGSTHFLSSPTVLRNEVVLEWFMNQQ